MVAPNATRREVRFVRGRYRVTWRGAEWGVGGSAGVDARSCLVLSGAVRSSRRCKNIRVCVWLCLGAFDVFGSQRSDLNVISFRICLRVEVFVQQLFPKSTPVFLSMLLSA